MTIPLIDRLAAVRHDWTLAEVETLFALPFADLLFQAQRVHRAHFDPNRVQVSTLLSIKTGGCPEDCAYCPQSVRYDTGVEREALMPVAAVAEAAARAKAAGATRFCMGAAWRSPKDRDLGNVIEMIRVVRELGLESCATLGMLSASQAAALATAGLDYYNHNLDTSPEFYAEVITTRTYQDRLDTLGRVRVQGKSREQARSLLADALAVQEAGAFAVVLELVPGQLAEAITERLRIPTIGIGAGAGCSGQIQVITDVLGLGEWAPRHARKYADLHATIGAALGRYRADVEAGEFPGAAETVLMDAGVLDEVLGRSTADRASRGAEMLGFPLDRDL